MIAKDSARKPFLVISRFPFQMEIADYSLNDGGFHDFIPHDFPFVSSNVTISLIYSTSFVNLQICKFKCKLTLSEFTALVHSSEEEQEAFQYFRRPI